MALNLGKPATFTLPRTEIYRVYNTIPLTASPKEIEDAWSGWLNSQDWWRTSGYILLDSGKAAFSARVHNRAYVYSNTRKEMNHNPRRQKKYMSGTYELEVREAERQVTADKLDEVSTELKRMQAELIAKDLMAKITSQARVCGFCSALIIAEICRSTRANR